MHGARRIATGAALLASLALAAPAGAGPDLVFVTVAKKRDGPYVAISPEVRVRSRAKDFFMRVTNGTTGIEDVALKDVSNDPGNDFRISWFRGKKEVTEAARGAGYGFEFDADESRTFRARVKPRVANPGELCLSGRFDVTSALNDPVGDFYVNSNNICG